MLNADLSQIMSCLFIESSFSFPVINMPTRQKYFTPAQVAAHNSPDDIWVSFLGKVYDLTPLIKKHAGLVVIYPFFCL